MPPPRLHGDVKHSPREVAALSSFFGRVEKWTIGVPPPRPHGDVIVIRPGRWQPYRPFFDWSKNGR